MSYVVRLRNNETGEVREQAYGDLEWNETAVAWWTEGNFGCDCNRRMQWQIAGGEVPDDDPPCGEGQYSAICAILPDGTEVLIDEE